MVRQLMSGSLHDLLKSIALPAKDVIVVGTISGFVEFVLECLPAMNGILT